MRGVKKQKSKRVAVAEVLPVKADPARVAVTEVVAVAASVQTGFSGSRVCGSAVLGGRSFGIR